MAKDNSTGKQKAALRRQARKALAGPPIVMETHGGNGVLFDLVYGDVHEGVVFETDPRKTDVLVVQRPTWSVYEGDCTSALLAGAGSHLTVNLLDIDPYGDPWPIIDAFFASERPRASEVQVVVNDGLRQKVQREGSWTTGTLRETVERHGNNLYAIYLDVCHELMAEKAAQAGYVLSAWAGYYAGYQKQMTHYWATLTRSVAE